MAKAVGRRDDPDDDGALLALFDAITSRRRRDFARQLDASRDLARRPIRIGASRVARYEATDLAVIHHTEHWQAKIAGREELSDFDLRVTTTFRVEDGTWKIVHRHADPIATVSEDGPLRQ